MWTIASQNEVVTTVEEWEGWCLLTDTIYRGDFDRVKELVQNGEILEGKTTCNPLHLAASRGHHEIVEFLIQKGLSVDSTLELEYPEPGFTPLHVAAQRNHLECARVLLKHGASVSSKIEGIGDPIHLAVFYIHRDMIALLLDNGANVNARFNNYFFEQTKDYLEKVDVLGESLHESLWRDHNLPLVHYLILRRYNKTLEKLVLKYGGDLNLKTSLGKTSLMQAVEVNSFILVNYLIKKRKANVNECDDSGKSVIHYLMLNTNRMISKYNKEEYAQRFEKEKILSCLIDHEVDVNYKFPKDSDYSCFIHYMIRYGYYEGFDNLLYYSDFDFLTIDLNSIHLGKINYEDLTPDIVNDLDYIQELRGSFEKITYSLVTFAISRDWRGVTFDKNLLLESPIHEWITQREFTTEIEKSKEKIRDELNRMKNVMIGDSNMSLHDVLFCRFNKLIRLMSNKRLNIYQLVTPKLLKENNIVYYYQMIICSSCVANFMSHAYKISTELIANLLINQLPMDCCETIVKYLDVETLWDLRDSQLNTQVI